MASSDTFSSSDTFPPATPFLQRHLFPPATPFSSSDTFPPATPFLQRRVPSSDALPPAIHFQHNQLVPRSFRSHSLKNRSTLQCRPSNASAVRHFPHAANGIIGKSNMSIAVELTLPVRTGRSTKKKLVTPASRSVHNQRNSKYPKVGVVI